MGAWQLTRILLAVLTIDASTSQIDQDVKEYCHPETFNGTCPTGEVILMQSARFGRMRVGRCLATSYFVGCTADVMSFLDNKCSGKQNCTVQVLDPDLLQLQPCRKDLMSYLEASYVCIKVPQAHRGCTSKGLFELSSPSGYLLFGKGNIIGTYSCPWSIRVDKGQRIEFTGYDFRTWRNKGTQGGTTSGTERDTACAQTLLIQDASEKEKVDVCLGGDRITPIYISKTNTVQVYLQHRFPVLDEYTFLVSYRAIGCPDLQTAPDLWVRRTEKTAIVTCNRTRETWHLVCREDTWIGDLKNCSQGRYSGNTFHHSGVDRGDRAETKTSGTTFHYGILIAVALGLILGILLGTVMLVCMMSYRRKRRQRVRRNKPNPLLGEHVDDKGVLRVATCSIKGDNTSVEGTLTSDLEDDKSRAQSVQVNNVSQELLQVEDGPDVIYSPRAGIGFRCQTDCVACNGPTALNRAAGADYIYGRLGRPSKDAAVSRYLTQNIELKNLRADSVTLPRNESSTSSKMAAV